MVKRKTLGRRFKAGTGNRKGKARATVAAASSSGEQPNASPPPQQSPPDTTKTALDNNEKTATATNQGSSVNMKVKMIGARVCILLDMSREEYVCFQQQYQESPKIIPTFAKTRP